MKKAMLLPLLAALCMSLFCACTPQGVMNLLLFTDNLNRINKNSLLSLSDYIIKDGSYCLILKNEGNEVLLTAEENEQGEIKKIRLTVSKTDEKGTFRALTDNHAQLFRAEAAKAFEAFTLFEKERCEETVKKILPSESEDFSKTGELTLDVEQYHIVYYSNKICSQFIVTDSFTEKTQSTQKPVSKPLYGVTANTAVNP